MLLLFWDVLESRVLLRGAAVVSSIVARLRLHNNFVFHLKIRFGDGLVLAVTKRRRPVVIQDKAV